MGTAKRWAMINQDSGEKTWLTPPEIIEALGHFDLDPCAADNMPWRTADRMVTKAENGLLVDWDGKRVWCNPPYGRESVPFLDKMARHADGGGGGGYALIFVRTDARYWHDYIFPFADAVFFFRGRLRFRRADGSLGEGCPTPSALISYSPRDTETLAKAGFKGSLVRLRR